MWQFNFKFNLTEDLYSQDSIDLLANSGLQLQKHKEEGITNTALCRAAYDLRNGSLTKSNGFHFTVVMILATR